MVETVELYSLAFACWEAAAVAQDFGRTIRED